MVVRVKFYKAEFDWAFNSPSGNPVGTYLREKALLVQNTAIGLAGERTGALKGSFSIDYDRSRMGPGAIIKASVPHALVHHEGAKPHVIFAKSGKSLKFPGTAKVPNGSGGFRVIETVVYARKVNHPGHEGNPYLTKALEAHLP